MVVELAKEFEIQGRICNLPLEMTEEEFWHTVIKTCPFKVQLLRTSLTRNYILKIH